ncbi:helix-turn-helix domain-containing protein [Streptomyces griseorubiginosus]|uniref:helix-turn-helix domain-containing protein n=1 Tax=Streptomyces griseorubiginosus TaxID=67304 RepID=UPI0036576A39
MARQGLRPHAPRGEVRPDPRLLAPTLSATLTCAGLGTKEFIDRRVILEANRPLAHSGQSAARIADHLGFPSPSHCSTFYHRGTEQTPITFRDTVHGHSRR